MTTRKTTRLSQKRYLELREQYKHAEGIVRGIDLAHMAKGGRIAEATTEEALQDVFRDWFGEKRPRGGNRPHV